MESEVVIRNESLAEEVISLNAIYGEGTINATFSDIHHTTLSLKFLQLGVSFYLRVLDEYPRSPPEVVGVDSLLASTEIQQYAVYFGACMRAVHSVDQVSLFDAIEEFDSIYESIQASSPGSEDSDAVATEKAERRANLLRNLALRARAKVDMGQSAELTGISPFNVVDCSSCLEPFFRIDTVNLKCRHSLCPECLHGKCSLNYPRLETRSKVADTTYRWYHCHVQGSERADVLRRKCSLAADSAAWRV
jgi:hypothetical protein